MRGDFKLMSYTTSYTILSYNDVNSQLTCEVQVMFNTQVTDTRTVKVTLPIDPVTSRVLSDLAQIDLLIKQEIQRRIPFLDQQVPPNIVNINEIYRLTLDQEAELDGYVLDLAGDPVVGVRVTTLADINGVVTDSLGYYAIQAQSTGSDIITIAGTAEYIQVTKPVTVFGLTRANITMRSKLGLQSTTLVTDAYSQENTVTNTARQSLNAQVILPAGSVVDSQGNAVDQVEVSIANTVTTDTGFVDGFPGLFLGQVGSATPVPIESYGYIDVDLTDPVTGAVLSLGTGQTATIQMPVNPDPVGEDTIDVWRLDPDTGIWEYKTTATRIGTTSVFEMTVDSFSTYNLDKAISSTQVLTIKAYNDMSTVDGLGTTPVAGVEVTVNMTSGWYGTGYSLWQGRGVTDSQGTLVLEVPPGFLNVRGKKGSDVFESYSYTPDGFGNTETHLFKFLEPLPVPPPPDIEPVTAVLGSVTFGSPVTQMTMVDATGIQEGLYFMLPGTQDFYFVTLVEDNTVTFEPAATFSMGVHLPNVTEFTFQPG